MQQITQALAQRLEMAEAQDGAIAAETQAMLDPDFGAAVKAIAGGYACFIGAGSPLTHALGIGLSGPVTAAEMDEVEDFFRFRGSNAVIDVCPYADLSLLEAINERNYRLTEMNNVLVKKIAPDQVPPEIPAGVEVRRIEKHEADRYADVIMRAFFGRDDLTEEEKRIGILIAHMDVFGAYLAFIGGQPAGGGSLSIHHGLGCCYGDATLPTHRRQGVHSALIAARIRDATAAGCDMMTAGTLPGSSSQRNYERFGFQVAYTRVAMLKEL